MVKRTLIYLSLFLTLISPMSAFADLQNNRPVIVDIENTTPDTPEAQAEITAYESENYVNAINELTPFSGQTVASNDGEADIQFILGEMYLGEKIIAPNLAKAAELFSQAAAKNHISAQFNLGLMYLTGNGLKQDKELAKKWLSKAAQSGDQNAKYCLDKEFKNADKSGQLSIPNEWITNAMSQKNAEALNRLANLYLQGHWVHQDKKLAYYWFFEAAEKGSADAQNTLGLAYQFGDYVEQNDTTALEWYRKAADQNDALAQYHLGLMHHDGIGTTKDLYQAAEWYKKAASQGLAAAQVNLGYFYMQEQVNPDYTEALKWYQKAAKQGNSTGQYNLGFMYNKGLGCKKDYNTAKNLYIQAASQGDLGAINNLGNLFESGSGVKKNLTVAYALFLYASEDNSLARTNATVMEDKLSQKQKQKAESFGQQLKTKGDFKKALDSFLQQKNN